MQLRPIRHQQGWATSVKQNSGGGVPTMPGGIIGPQPGFWRRIFGKPWPSPPGIPGNVATGGATGQPLDRPPRPI